MMIIVIIMIFLFINENTTTSIFCQFRQCKIPAVPYVVLDMFDVLVVGEVFVHCHLHHEVAHVAGEDLNATKQHPRTHNFYNNISYFFVSENFMKQ